MSQLRRSAGLVLMLAVLAVLACANSAHAAIIALNYQYVDHPTNFHPTTQGWTGPLTQVGVDGNGGVSSGTNNSVASALQLNDTDVVVGPAVTGVVNFADLSGEWTLTARLRVDSANSSASTMLGMGTGTRFWNLWFNFANSTVDTRTFAGNDVVLASSIDLTQFHTYKLVGNGDTAPELWIDGVPQGVYAGGWASGANVMQWGSIFTGGVQGVSNWQLVQLEVPEPASLGLLGAGALLLLRKRR